MLIYLYGSDSYRRQKKLNYYTEEYQKKYSNLSCDFFDLDPSAGSRQNGEVRFKRAAGQEEFLRLREFSSQQLLFNNKKMAVLRNIFEADEKELKEFFKKYLKSEDFTILISENKLPPAKLKFITEEAFKVEEFPNLEAEKWRFFVQKEAAGRKLNLTSEAINFLSKVYWGDGWGLINELEKLSLISRNSSIGVEDLKEVGDYGYESPDIFGYINAVIKKCQTSDVRCQMLSVIALEKLFIVQEEPAKIFNFFASLNRLPDQLIKKLANYDVMVKSGKMDYDEVLVDLALS